jgi:hypothetical protein
MIPAQVLSRVLLARLLLSTLFLIQASLVGFIAPCGLPTHGGGQAVVTNGTHGHEGNQGSHSDDRCRESSQASDCIAMAACALTPAVLPSAPGRAIRCHACESPSDVKGLRLDRTVAPESPPPRA